MNKRLSRLYKNSIMNLYKNGEYSVDYLILKASDMYEKGKLTEDDFNELMDFFEKEQEKEMAKELEDTKTEENEEENVVEVE